MEACAIARSCWTGALGRRRNGKVVLGCRHKQVEVEEKVVVFLGHIGVGDNLLEALEAVSGFLNVKVSRVKIGHVIEHGAQQQNQVLALLSFSLDGRLDET